MIRYAITSTLWGSSLKLSRLIPNLPSIVNPIFQFAKHLFLHFLSSLIKLFHATLLLQCWSICPIYCNSRIQILNRILESIQFFVCFCAALMHGHSEGPIYGGAVRHTLLIRPMARWHAARLLWKTARAWLWLSSKDKSIWLCYNDVWLRSISLLYIACCQELLIQLHELHFFSYV